MVGRSSVQFMVYSGAHIVGRETVGRTIRPSVEMRAGQRFRGVKAVELVISYGGQEICQQWMTPELLASATLKWVSIR